jgi:DNA-binding NarL/FixJ family response regulator
MICQYFVNGVSVAEIAKKMQLPVDTVRAVTINCPVVKKASGKKK